MSQLSTRYGPWAVVVGASDGIGAALATELAAAGLHLILVARRQLLLAELAQRLRAGHGVEVRTVVADIGTPAGLDAVSGLSADLAADSPGPIGSSGLAADSPGPIGSSGLAADSPGPIGSSGLAADSPGPIGSSGLAADSPGPIGSSGLLVVNAALAPVAPFATLRRDQLDAMLDVNCRAAVVLTHAFGRVMLGRGRGGIILLSSMAGNQGSALVAHYAATKAYLRVLAEGLWSEWRGDGVDVLACCPGLVRTPTFDRGSPARPERLVPPPISSTQVARAALRALGRQPVVIPGWRNRFSAAVAARLLPRMAVIRLATGGIRTLYPDSRNQP